MNKKIQSLSNNHFFIIRNHLVFKGPIQIRIYGKVGHNFEENYFFSDGTVEMIW